MVHEVLQGVQGAVDRRQGHRRPARRAVADALHERGEVLLLQPPGGAVGQPLQLGDQDARRGQRVTLAHEQVDDQVLDVPALAQRGSLLPGLQGGVAQGGTLGARQRLHARDRRVPAMRCGMSWAHQGLPLSDMCRHRDIGLTTARPPGRPPGQLESLADPEAGSTLRDGFAVLGVGDPARAGDLHALHARQPALRCADRRRRLGARLVHRPRAAAGVPAPGDHDRRVWSRCSPCSSASRSCARSASWRVGWAPGSCSTGCRPPTAARSPASTSRCRCRGTSSTRPASCSPTPTPTSRRPGRPIAPLPMAVGTLAMMVIAVGQMLLHRRGDGRRRPAGLPAGDAVPT